MFIIIACVQNYTHLFFYSGYIMSVYFSSHGSLLIGLPLLPSFVVYCFCSCDVRSDLVYIEVCSDLVFGDVCSILLPTMRSDIFGSLWMLIVMADGRV